MTIAETDFNRYTDDAMPIRHIDGDIDQRARYRFVETGWRKLAETRHADDHRQFRGDLRPRSCRMGARACSSSRTTIFRPTQRTLLMVFDLAEAVALSA